MRCQHITSQGKRCRKKATGRYRDKDVCTECYKVLIWKGKCKSYTEKRRKNKELKK